MPETGEEMTNQLRTLAERCQIEDGKLKVVNENGNGYYCFMNPENISDGCKCKYQGDLKVSEDNHIHIECEFRDIYSKRSKRTIAYLMEGC